MSTRQITLTLPERLYQYLLDYICQDALAFSIFLIGTRGEAAALKELNNYKGDDSYSPVGALPPRKQEAPAAPVTMTLAEALVIGQNAASLILTGAPVLSAFDIEKVDAAMELLHGLAYETLEGTRQGKILAYVCVALAQVQRCIQCSTKPRRARGPQKISLRAALDALSQLIDEAQRNKDDRAYWQVFRQEVLAEFESLIEGEVRDE